MPKFEYFEVCERIFNDIQTYLNINWHIAIDENAQTSFNLKKAEFKIPSLASRNEKFPNTSIKELKKKILSTLTSRLEHIEDEDFMFTSFKTASEKKRASHINTNGAIIDEEDYLKDDT